MFLFLLFVIYTGFVYTVGTKGPSIVMNADAIKGKLLYQKYNCTACHQLYGLGGYLGPELTTVISQKGKGSLYADAIMKSGTERMPDFHLPDIERQQLIAFFTYVDSTAITYKN